MDNPMDNPRPYVNSLIARCELTLAMWKGIYSTLGVEFECRSPTEEELTLYEMLLIKRVNDDIAANEIAKGYIKPKDKG